MKLVLLIPIQIYWIITPKHNRRSCIFSESCSKYVYRITKECGLMSGFKALLRRKQQCRTGYHFIFKTDNDVFIQLADKSVINANELSDNMKLEASAIKKIRLNDTSVAEKRN